MNRGRTLDEVFVLRSIACLSIAFLHSINKMYQAPDEFINVIRLLLSFGTPAFVFISELVLSYAYPNGITKGFWSKRIKYIIVPYVIFGIINAMADAVLQTDEPLLSAFLSFSLQYVLLGDFSAYFIVIIFQFYLLHAYVVPKIIHKLSMRTALISTMLISMAYWAFFNFVPQFEIPFKTYFYHRFFMLPFVGWIFYFTLAYYCGRHYREMIQLINKFRYGVWTFVILTGAWMVGNLLTDTVQAVSSKRFDMVLFVTGMVFLILQLSSKFKRVPDFWIRTSQLSFGLFLLHPIVYGVMEKIMVKVPGMAGTPLGVIVLFVIGMLLTAWGILILNRFSWGAYIVGRIGIGRREEAGVMQKQTSELPLVKA